MVIIHSHVSSPEAITCFTLVVSGISPYPTEKKGYHQPRVRGISQHESGDMNVSHSLDPHLEGGGLNRFIWFPYAPCMEYLPTLLGHF